MAALWIAEHNIFVKCDSMLRNAGNVTIDAFKELTYGELQRARELSGDARRIMQDAAR